MKLCINSQDLQDFILTRLDFNEGHEKKKRGKNMRRRCKKGKFRIGGEPLLGGAIKVRKSIISSPLFSLCTAFTLAFDFIPSLEYI